MQRSGYRYLTIEISENILGGDYVHHSFWLDISTYPSGHPDESIQ